MRGRRGFSSLELAAALSLICVLALLVSLFGRHVFHRARAVSCASNLRQIGNAMRLYADEHGGRYPPTAANAAFTLLSPYVRNDAIYLCPEDPEPLTVVIPPLVAPVTSPPTAESPSPPKTSYFVCPELPSLMTDDAPGTMICGDTAARHLGYWQAVCIDGRVTSISGRQQSPPVHHEE